MELEGPTNLKAQVGQLERERAELSSDNQRLRAEIKQNDAVIKSLRDESIKLRTLNDALLEKDKRANEKFAVQFDEEKRGFLHKIAKLEAERDQRNGFQAAMFEEWRKAFEKIWPGDESGLSPEQSAPYMADEILKLRAERDKFEAAYHRAKKEFAALEASKKEADSELRRMGREAGELKAERSKLFWEKEELRAFVGQVRLAMWPEDLKNSLAQLEAGTTQPTLVAEPLAPDTRGQKLERLGVFVRKVQSVVRGTTLATSKLSRICNALAELDAGTWEPAPVAEPATCPECERLQAVIDQAWQRIKQSVSHADVAGLLAVLAEIQSNSSTPAPVAEPLEAEGGK